jgi:hypothetical protein
MECAAHLDVMTAMGVVVHGGPETVARFAARVARSRVVDA